MRSLVERFRSQTTVPSQAEIHPRAVEDRRQHVIAVAQISPRAGEAFSPQATDLSARANQEPGLRRRIRWQYKPL